MDEQVGRHETEPSPVSTGGQKLLPPPPELKRLAPPQPVRRRGRLWVWLPVLLLLAVAAALAWWEFRPAATPTAATAPAAGKGAGSGPPQPVGVATAATGDVRVVLDALGTVTPLATVTVKTQIAGQLQRIGFSEGQLVHKGDFLAQIDPRPYQAALEQAEGQLAKDQALLKQAQADLARFQTLLKQDSIARQQADNQIFVVQQDQGAIRSDQANVDTQQLNLTYCRIIAPVDGRVGLRQVDAGNYVQTSDANGIVVITQLQPISVIFTLAEDYLPAVRKQTHAGNQLVATAYDRANVTKLATGELETTDNQIDTTTGTFKLRALFPNADESLFPNQFVNIRLLVDTLRGVVTVPVAAVQRGAPGTYVYAVDASGSVSVKPVKLGVTDNDTVQVISGLAAGDRVVIDGADRLRDGVKVSVQPAKPAAPAATGGGGSGQTGAPGVSGAAAGAPAAGDPANPDAGADPSQQHHHHRQQQQQNGP
jgi:multidrug efflux system membrane fusion protein